MRPSSGGEFFFSFFIRTRALIFVRVPGLHARFRITPHTQYNIYDIYRKYNRYIIIYCTDRLHTPYIRSIYITIYLARAKPTKQPAATAAWCIIYIYNIRWHAPPTTTVSLCIRFILL